MIRNAEESDLEGILEIYNDAIVNTTSIYTYDVETLEQRKKWYKDRLNNNLPIIVCIEENQVAGFATFGPFRPHAAYKYTIEHSIYVHKNMRCKGVGSALMHRIISIAKSSGYMTMVAGIDAFNRDSIMLHEKFNFNFVGIINRAGYKFDKWLDLAFYQLDLTKF